MDVWDILYEIDNNIGGSVTDEDLKEWAKVLATAVYESNDMERDKGEGVYHLVKQWNNARKRINAGYRIVHNKILEVRYHNLYIFFCGTTKGVDAVISDRGDEASAILRAWGKQDEQQAFSEPQQRAERESNKPARKRGRPKETLKDIMIKDKDGGKLKKVRAVMEGKKGKAAALIILACIRKGWMQKPTFAQVKEEFGDIGAQQGFVKYLNGNQFTKDEIEGAINSLD